MSTNAFISMAHIIGLLKLMQNGSPVTSLQVLICLISKYLISHIEH